MKSAVNGLIVIHYDCSLLQFITEDFQERVIKIYE